MLKRLSLSALTLGVGFLAQPAFASFHLMQIEQVIGGVNGDTTRQAIQLRMRQANQNLVGQATVVAWDATGRHRFRAAMVMAFAGLTLMLAMVGVFGILAYSVQQRTRDFGVRRAFGATTGAVLRLVAGGAVRVVAAGVVVGLALSAVFARLLRTILFGVEPLDLTTFATVTIVLAVTAAVAMAGPAWRAARVDPSVALRSQ